MQFTVENLATKDSWKDIVRIPEPYRTTVHGDHIGRGTICKLTVNDKSKYVIVRGSKRKARTINMDLNLRLFLKVKEANLYDFELRKASWFQCLLFAWSASDPIYRVPAQLSLISLALGLLGLFLGVVPLLHRDQCTPPPQSTESSAPPIPGKPNSATR